MAEIARDPIAIRIQGIQSELPKAHVWLRARYPGRTSGVGGREPGGCWIEAAWCFHECNLPQTRMESNDGISRRPADITNYDVIVAMVVPYGVSQKELGGTVRLEGIVADRL